MSESEARGAADLAEEDLLRAGVYSLLARLLAAPPGADALAAAAGLRGDGSDFGRALGRLAGAAREATPEAVSDEFHDLFIGAGTADLQPYASYYQTGFLYERPLAELRADMAELGLALADGVSEPEDHIAALCEVMCALITGACGERQDLARQRAFFDRHIGPWAGRFFDDLEASPRATFFASVGALGKRFLRIEAQAFEMAA